MKFRNIGDVLLTSPMADALAKLPEKPNVTFLVKKGTEDMLEGHPHIHQVLTLPKRETSETKYQFLKRQWQFIQYLRQQQFDISINTTEGDRGILIGWLIQAKQRISYLKPNEKWWRKKMVNKPFSWSLQKHRHTVLKNLDLIKEIITLTNIQVTLATHQQDDNFVEKLLLQNGRDISKSLVHIHPVSRWFFKCWRDNYMAEIIDFIQCELNKQVVVTCAPDQKETQKLENILQLCQSKPINLGAKLTLKQTAALSKQAELFFGVDSAPMHMAAAVNTPCIAIFGPSGVFEWGAWPNGWSSMKQSPYPNQNGSQEESKHVMLQGDKFCIPCGQAGCNNSKKSECLEVLDPTMVKQALLTTNKNHLKT